MRNHWRLAALLLLVGTVGGCAAIGAGLLPPRFSIASEQPSELRLLGPSLQRPLGGASIRIHARVENPNPVGVTLRQLTGTLQLEGYDAADADFPLGVPLAANGTAVVPLDISVSFSNLPGLAEVVGNAVISGSVSYTLAGTAQVDAGAFGMPTFGPMTILRGELDARR
jgi:hypothetical protein